MASSNFILETRKCQDTKKLSLALRTRERPEKTQQKNWKREREREDIIEIVDPRIRHSFTLLFFPESAYGRIFFPRHLRERKISFFHEGNNPKCLGWIKRFFLPREQSFASRAFQEKRRSYHQNATRVLSSLWARGNLHPSIKPSAFFLPYAYAIFSFLFIATENGLERNMGSFLQQLYEVKVGWKMLGWDHMAMAKVKSKDFCLSLKSKPVNSESGSVDG